MFKIIKVIGSSLAPEYNHGDYLVITSLPILLRSIKVGATVVFEHPVHGTMVKKIGGIDPHTAELTVIGTHPGSTDSRHFGPIPRHWLTGKVLWHIPKPG